MSPPIEVVVKCPTCTSPRPDVHPLGSSAGEIRTCPDPWHASTLAGQRILRVLAEREELAPAPVAPPAIPGLETVHATFIKMGLVPPFGSRMLAEEFVRDFQRIVTHEHAWVTWDIEEDGRRWTRIVCADALHPVPVVRIVEGGS